jgi:pilus assembly protein CpaD
MSLNRVLALVLLSAGLTACASAPDNPARMARSSSALYPLHAEMGADQVALTVHATGLSAAQAAAVTDLATRWRDGRAGPIVLDFPAKTESQVAARVRDAAVQLLAAQGVPVSEVRFKTYETADAAAPLLVSFNRLQAVVAACGLHWDGLTYTSDNHVQPNFGCAVSANVASQIANAGDIVQPRGEDMPSAARRTSMLNNYDTGKPVTQDDGSKGTISKAVN